MSRTAPTRTDCPQAGFTIIEVLIALVVVAVCIVAIGSVMSTSLRGVRSLEQHVELMQTARSVMTTAIPPRAELGPGTVSGRQHDHQWRIDVGPLGGAWIVPDSEAAWTPELVKIHVQSPTGAGLDLETIRLMHRRRQ